MPVNGPHWLRKEIFTIIIIDDPLEATVENNFSSFPTALAVDLGTVRGLPVDCDRLVRQHCFWSLTLEPETPAGHPKYQKTQIVSKDSVLVSNKNFSEILPSSSLHLGPGEVGQGGLKALHFWRHSKNPQHPTKTTFLIANYTRLAEFLEPLNSSLLLSVPELCSHTAMCGMFFLALKLQNFTGCESVKNELFNKLAVLEKKIFKNLSQLLLLKTCSKRKLSGVESRHWMIT